MEFIKGTWLGLNVAVWTVSFMNLQTDNIIQILVQGKAFALEVGKKLAEFMNDINAINKYTKQISELEELIMAGNQELNDLHDGTDTGDGDDKFIDIAMGSSIDKIMEKMPKLKLFGVDVNDNVKSGFSGFSNGYNAAVGAYFHIFSGSKDHAQVSTEEERKEKEKEKEEGKGNDIPWQSYP